MSKDYYININGEKISVSEEVYRAYKQPVWKESKRAKVRSEHEYSYDGMLDDGMEIATADALLEDIVADKLLLDMLFEALEELTADERNLIDLMFYQNKSEREVARETGIHRNTLSYRKNKILAKLKEILEK